MGSAPWWVLRLLLRREDRRSVMGDLEELYEHRRARDGEAAADAWLRRQLLAYPWRLLVERLRPDAGADAGRPSTTEPRRAAGEVLRTLLQDVRLSLRSLTRAPALAATIVLTVGLGIGATTAIFAVVHAVLLRPLPYPEPTRLVRIYTDTPPFRWPLSLVDYLALREQQTSFQEVSGYQNVTMSVSRAGVAERLRGKLVTATYFSVLGVRPLHGRVFDRSDGLPGGRRVVVVSHGFWERHLGGEPGVVGSPIRLDGNEYTVVGVLPREVGPFEQGRDFFAAADWPPPTRKGPFFIMALARLRPGVSRASAQEELRVINRRIFPLWQASYQDQKSSWGAMDLKEVVVGSVGPTLLVTQGTVGLVLLIACVNAANLLVARVTRRRRELAVRSALGASRGRLLQHLLSESAVLVFGAAGVAAAVAAGAIRLVTTAGASYIPRTHEVSLSVPVLGFLAALAVAAAALFGLVPSLQGLVSRLDQALGSGGRSATDARGPRRLRQALVAGEFAVATPLLVAAALLVSSLARLQRVDPGFDERNVLTASVSLPPGTYHDAAVDAFWDQARTRLGALAGVSGVALADSRPPNQAMNVNNFDLEDHPTPPGQTQPNAVFVAASPGYFRVLGLAVIAGRVLEDRDEVRDAPPVVVVDQAWARRFFPGQEAVGRRFREGGCTDCPWTTVVGVVGTVKYGGLDSPDQGTVYWPIATGQRSLYAVVRTTSDPGTVLPAVRDVFRELDPTVPLSDVATMEELIVDALEVPRYLSALVASFATLALVLSVVGIYGVMSYAVQQETKDIGIRLALGAEPAGVVRMVVASGMQVVGVGVLLGISGAFALTRLFASLLFGVAPNDPPTLLGVTTLMLATALLACLVPACRAAALDPAATLRDE